jgi:hypothetical protein
MGYVRIFVLRVVRHSAASQRRTVNGERLEEGEWATGASNCTLVVS